MSERSPVEIVARENRKILAEDISELKVELADPNQSNPQPMFVDIVSDILQQAGIDLTYADVLAQKVDAAAIQFFAQRGDDVRPNPGLLIASRLESAPLAKTLQGRAYIRVLQGENKPSLSEDADRLGCSKEGLRKSEELTRRALFS